MSAPPPPPPPPTRPSKLLQNLSAGIEPKRADDLTLLENVPCGPVEHQPPADDPHFARLEPYTGIHLSKRTLPYKTLQSHFEGRYFLNFSKLYSVVREVPGSRGTKYDVPTDGEWITIGIVAERTDIKFTNVSEQPSYKNNNTSQAASSSKKGSKSKNIKDEETPGNRPKKYMSMKLVDLGTNSDKKGIRGDQMLTMLLFEADEAISSENDGVETSKTYKGGSGGAFEACMKIHEGAVIAILQPKILKPYQVRVCVQRISSLEPTESNHRWVSAMAKRTIFWP